MGIETEETAQLIEEKGYYSNGLHIILGHISLVRNHAHNLLQYTQCHLNRIETLNVIDIA
ncbi:hypothetical protein QD460_30170 [Rhizobium jaguaris]|uniref:hypothetical protein n=1 Tax=Rhizobium jaguaris TaxID=1312183 RepID=UPI0039BF91D1